ncbi:MAG TPA: sigma-54 dependent transcriptional regulator [Saprospiraceae bacterium]|nr:sigma-54-dependent Fis family transcriptional regulator [Saprospiraceae bacterium]MCB9328321.1 sigma-54-dependent Fis family transcriptional regulator [Lewinellaceae bacterium]HPQ21504.1 sigma-54 dependent transcriptional regulator [Saprospiraceae bacterium]HRX30003.1 sigma-54 dependent transcriptional regulator [Saprospiraceae bacterium]
MNLQSVKQRFGIIGRSEKLDRALETAVRVAGTDLSVLIQGESGVGKEVFSRVIHDLSKRKHNNFIAINCGAIPAGTINSELFGHEKGAFTGATSDRKGYFETVSGGTIFLDEIGEMPLDTQSFLLRILESGEFIKVGSSKVQTTDVRVIAATNVNLENLIKKGKFREDLYYRLNTVPIYVPALHERREDIYMLFRKFAVDFAEKYRSESIQIDNEARAIIENYKWPGNVRELKNVVEQLSVLSEDNFIDAATLLDVVPKLATSNVPIKLDATGENLQEREILFKFLYEMKHDLNDLKNLVFGLIKQNNLNIPDGTSPAPNPNYSSINYLINANDNAKNTHQPEFDEGEPFVEKPIIIHQDDKRYHDSEIVEESLSLEDMEKDMIKKALKKFKGRRKDAAQELGISERTLYRKLKQYDLEE